jgi:hypothetical protein
MIQWLWSKRWLPILGQSTDPQASMKNIMVNEPRLLPNQFQPAPNHSQPGPNDKQYELHKGAAQHEV